MDFVKREVQNIIDEENYKVYLENLQKSHQMETEYQHTAISMEQLHQAMQSSLNASTLVHNFQLPLSPRQMTTLMMKTNHISRSLNFNEIPAHLPRNLASEMDLMMHNATDIPQNLRHEDILLGHSLNRNLDISLVRNLNELEMQNALVQNLSEQDLQRNVGELMPQNLTHEMDLSHHSNMLGQDERRTPLVIQDGHIIESNLAQNLAPRLTQGVLHESMKLEQGDHFLPMPLYIKSEQEDSYFYDNISQGMENVSGLNGQIAEPSHVAAQSPQDLYMYNHVANPALNPIHNYIQNYATNARENPQNLVVQKQFDTIYQEDLKKTRDEKESKVEEPKENLKPTDNKFYQEYNFPEKNGEVSDDPSMNIKGEYICYRCNEVFPSKRGLKQHSKSCVQEGEVAEKVSKFACSQCAYRCQSPAILKIHERTHSGEKPFSCTFCDYKSGQKNNVAKHILVHMKEKPFRCQYCDYRCAQKNNLVVHERTHTGYKPFACPYCDYRTVQKPNLVKHMYLHTDQKPFSCDVCSYRCVQKTNLTKHKQRHMNEKDGEKVDVKGQVKPYRPRQKSVKCPHCSYRCVQKISLEKHMQFKHSDAASWDSKQESDEVIQNLSVKKDEYEQSEGKVLQIQS